MVYSTITSIQYGLPSKPPIFAESMSRSGSFVADTHCARRLARTGWRTWDISGGIDRPGMTLWRSQCLLDLSFTFTYEKKQSWRHDVPEKTPTGIAGWLLGPRFWSSSIRTLNTTSCNISHCPSQRVSGIIETNKTILELLNRPGGLHP